MAQDLKYGKVTVENEPGNPLNDTDEPVFIIRARDVASVNAIRAYFDQAGSYGVSHEFQLHRDPILESFETWQANHQDLVKVPD